MINTSSLARHQTLFFYFLIRVCVTYFHKLKIMHPLMSFTELQSICRSSFAYSITRESNLLFDQSLHLLLVEQDALAQLLGRLSITNSTEVENLLPKQLAHCGSIHSIK